MSKYSNSVSYNSPDGLPSNPYPLVPVKTTCSNCYEKITEDPCPHCGAQNDIDMEPDFEAGQREYDKYDDV
jgi:predicted amidophosphoribosyltransferase